jgi:hypothetical protein
MIDVEYVPEVTEDAIDIVPEPGDGDTVIEPVERPNGGTFYRVEREIVVQKEKYIVHTRDGTGSEVRHYHVEREDGEWELTRIRKVPNRGHPTIVPKRRAELTPGVREALTECGVEVGDE